jgi:hypothetical protein
VADEKPPRLAGNDRDTLLALFHYQRQSFVRKVSGVESARAKMSPVGSGTSLLWLTNHMADAETTWVLERFAGRSSETAGPHAKAITDAAARYQRVWAEVDDVIAGETSLDAEGRPFDDQPAPNLRWILAHLLEETARHAGHADILRELIDGQTGR